MYLCILIWYVYNYKHILKKTYLLLWNLFVAVNIQSLKQVWWILLEPHEQVTRWDAFFKAYQFDVKDQHSAAWNTSS